MRGFRFRRCDPYMKQGSPSNFPRKKKKWYTKRGITHVNMLSTHEDHKWKGNEDAMSNVVLTQPDRVNRRITKITSRTVYGGLINENNSNK